MILVIGASAPFGRETVEELLAAGCEVRALSRKPAEANLPAGAEAVYGDLTRPETLAPALRNVSGIFLALPYGMDAAPLLKLVDPGTRVVFLSSGAVDDHAASQSDAIAAYHAGVEQGVAAATPDWTFLRIFFPAINSLPYAMQLKNCDTLRIPCPDAESAPVHERDVAAVAARVLTEDGHAGRVYDLTGPQSYTQAGLIGVIGGVLGRDLTVEELDPEPLRHQLSQFMDPGFVAALFGLMAGTAGKPAGVTTAVEHITGRPARGFAQWAADRVADFS